MTQSYNTLSASCTLVMDRASPSNPIHNKEKILDKENLKLRSSNHGDQNLERIASLLHASNNNNNNTHRSAPVSSKLLREHLEQISLTPQRKRLAPGVIHTRQALVTPISSKFYFDSSDKDSRSSFQSFQPPAVSWGQQPSEHDCFSTGLRARADTDPVASTLLQKMDDDDLTPVLSDNLQELFHPDQRSSLIRPKATKRFITDE